MRWTHTAWQTDAARHNTFSACTGRIDLRLQFQIPVGLLTFVPQGRIWACRDDSMAVWLATFDIRSVRYNVWVWNTGGSGGRGGAIRPCLLQSGHGPHPIRQSGHKISKIGATRCQILRLKCTKFDFRWRSAPDPSLHILQRSPDPLTVFKGPTSKGTEGKGDGREGVKREGEVRWKGRGRLPPNWGVRIRQWSGTSDFVKW